MGQILEKIEELSGGTCYQTERYTLDHFVAPEYQDDGEDFNKTKVHETDNKKSSNHLARYSFIFNAISV